MLWLANVLNVLGFVYEMKRRTFECIQGAITRGLLCSFDFKTPILAIEINLVELRMRKMYLKHAL